MDQFSKQNYIFQESKTLGYTIIMTIEEYRPESDEKCRLHPS